MTATMTRTAGQTFAATARRYFSIGARTRRYRDGRDMHAEVLEAIEFAATMPGYYTERTQDALGSAFAAALGYEKHIGGFRANGTVIAKVNAMSPWQFAAMLGDMVDAGVENTYQAGEFFRSLA